jgi:hypothetical protein
MHSNFFTGRSLVFYNGPVSGRLLVHFCVHFYRGCAWLCFDPTESSNFDTMESRRIEPRCQKEPSEVIKSRLKDLAKNKKYHRKELSSQRTSTVLSLFWYVYSRQVYRQPNPKTRKKVANEDPWRVQHFDLQGGADQMLKQIT